MRKVQAGDTVTVHYVGTLDNGRIFDSATAEEPLTITMGAGQVFPALERELLGMQAGETKNILIPAAEAYGERLRENVLKVERSMFPLGKVPVVGEKLRIEFRGGVERLMQIVEVGEGTVTLDGNHPLAGLDLTFALTLVEIA
jgi:peptidylprolyl isomerase